MNVEDDPVPAAEYRFLFVGCEIRILFAVESLMYICPTLSPHKLTIEANVADVAGIPSTSEAPTA